MKKEYFLLVMFVNILIIYGCNKPYVSELTYAKNSLAGTWAKPEPFYSATQQRFDEVTGNWRNFIAFSYTSEGEPDILGYGNVNVPGKGTNAFDMVRLYTAQILSSDSGSFNVVIPKALQFVPKSADSLQVGTVKVLPQNVKMTRTNKTTFLIGIKGQGTYNLTSKYFEVEIEFDETSIAGPASIKRKYRVQG